MAGTSAEAVSSAIGTFYAAAHGETSWRDALRGLADLFDAPRAWLFVSSPAGLKGHTSVEDAGFHSRAAQDAMLADRLFHLTHSIATSTIVRHSELEDLRGFYRRPLFNDWLRERDTWFGLQAHLRVREHERVFVDISHGRKQGEFAERHKRLLAAIGPHVLRAGDLSAFTGRAERAGEGTLPALVVDRGLRVRRMNEAAAKFLERHDTGLALSHGFLRVASPATRRRLEGLVADALASPLDGHGGGLILLDDAGETGCGRHLASIAPLPAAETFGFPGEPLTIIHLRPVDESGDEALDRTLQAMFGLQPSHARLARLLGSGMGLKRAATERGLSYASARTYLDQIFRKTGTSRQGELVALLKTVLASRREG